LSSSSPHPPLRTLFPYTTLFRSADVEAALRGARDIVAEAIADHADVRAFVRQSFEERGTLTARAARGKEGERSKFEDYYDHTEPDRKSTRLNSSHVSISYAVFCL